MALFVIVFNDGNIVSIESENVRESIAQYTVDEVSNIEFVGKHSHIATQFFISKNNIHDKIAKIAKNIQMNVYGSSNNIAKKTSAVIKQLKKKD